MTIFPLLPVNLSFVTSTSASATPSPAVTPLLSHSTATVSAAKESASAETDLPAHSSSCDDSVGPDNVEGYGAVQDLADFLVGLRDHHLALTQEECSQIIALWQALGDYDKRKTAYPSRHQTSLSKGRFRATKKIVAAGVESTKRSFIGNHSPAQWPDCNRVVEAVFVKLFARYPSTVHCEGTKVSRYTVVVRAYKNIRECVITNARLMSETTIQLPEVNPATVSQWYCRRCKAQERDILKQGIPAQQAPMAAPAKLPAALQKGQTVAFGTLAQPHLFVLPPNTAGQAQLKERPQHQAPPQQFVFIQRAPPAPLPVMVPRLPAMPKPSNIANTPIYISIPPSSPTQSTPQAVPYTTQQYRRRKMEAEQAGISKRKYSKKTDIIVCSKCQKDRKPQTHRQYFGNWYCEETETQSYEEWRALLEKREYGKRKKK
ncbi:uncharacterized protein LOC121651452 [Melanotaenia boesemani]|uniref:uncharacterized protein LOC121651452 n=1 Tax=Melanotaenia boesemani TaxID=1250792 RepID=UPI001C051F4D|nr:uncharacterized protein LOC121651452 [Melanotaenia boesemani]